MDERLILVFALFVLVVFYVDGAACGNAVLEESEVCDINRLNSQNCTNFNYTGGSLSCLDDCSGYDFSLCTGDEVCGNGIILGSEICEPENVRGRTCEDEGYEGGTLKCRNDCIKYDYSECTGVKSVCGDNNVTGSEDCDGLDINNKSCSDFEYDFGVLRCNNNCTFNYEYCFSENVEEEVIDELVDVNDTKDNETEQNSNKKIPSGVVGVASDADKDRLSLGTWLIIFGGFLALGIIILYVYFFKIKK